MAITAWSANVLSSSICRDVLDMQGIYHVARQEYAAALHVAEDMLQLALEQNHTIRKVRAHIIMGRSLHLLGEFSRAVGHFKRVLSVRTSETDPSTDLYGRTLAAGPYQAVALSHLAVDLLVLGYLDQAVARRNQALVLARKANHPYGLAVALFWASVVDRYRGAQTTSFECLTELATLARQQRFSFFSRVAEVGFGMILSASGKAAEGLARARHAVAEYATVPGQRFLLSLAICCEGAGEVDEALQLLDGELEVANATGERFYEAQAHWLKGEWLLAHRPARSAEAEDCYQHALTVARKQQAKFWELRASVGLARLWLDQGKRSEARDLLASIYGWFTEGLDTPVLKEAKALLDELA
jgi:tetratricopeptide (TPR) repeat protein